MSALAFLAKSFESMESAQGDLASRRYNSCARGSYYACFQAAVAALIKEGIRPQGKWAHGFVQAQFSGLLIHRRKLYDSQFRHVLPQTLKLRHRADYEEAAVSERWSRELIGQSKRFVEAVGSRVNGAR